ncbi:hypothetical protein [Polyangium sp. 15x6]|uniref:hypothetical protein n=1 Tax=Polyangium sp. 15x6 TaxID=3042687 RepID=UPI00249C84D1|nr:hypothetical protein [Polyangium sp. 15x6]MDI3283882.1 hypothetical protein [Polyangium sp. 15x6]
MIVAPDAMLHLVAPLLPEALLAASARSALQAVTRGLPRAASGIALECRLEENPRVDFLMYLLARSGGPRALLRCAPALDARAWRGVLDFCGQWVDPASPLHTEIPALWLEFDVNGDSVAARQPLPFACIERHICDEEPPEEQDERGRAGCLDILDRATTLLLGRPLPCGTFDTMTRLVERLPRRGRVLHVAPLASRGIEALRLVATIPRDELPAHLDRIEWPGARPRLEPLLAATVPANMRIGFHLDMGDRVLPTLGIELHHPPGDPRWCPILDELVAWGVCTPDKRDALLQFPPYARLALPEHRAPSPVSTTLGIKLVLAPDEPLAAKAYLGFVPLHPLLG